MELLAKTAFEIVSLKTVNNPTTKIKKKHRKPLFPVMILPPLNNPLPGFMPASLYTTRFSPSIFEKGVLISNSSRIYESIYSRLPPE